MFTDKLFTGQREMAGLGIYHYGARFYSPKLGRFLSADTIVPSYANPQSLNRYMYVLGNPLKYIDPTGHDSVCGNANSDPECESPADDPVVITNPDPLDDGLEQDDPTPSTKIKDEKLTRIQLIGQVFTFTLIETTLLLPADFVLLALTGAAAGACLDSVLLACAAEIPLGAVDVVVADFQISLASTIAQNVETGTHHDFAWIIIPNLLATLPDTTQQNIYDLLPGLR